MEKLGLGLSLITIPYILIIAFLVYRRNRKQAQLKQQPSKVTIRRKRY